MDSVRQEILRQLNSDLSDQLEFAVVCETKVYPKDRKDLEERILRLDFLLIPRGYLNAHVP
jgi:hypothetical protein